MVTKAYVLATLFCLFGCGQLAAQTLKVIDKTTKQPLEHVVLYQPGGASTITNARGEADLKAFSRETDLQLQHAGYTHQHLSFARLQTLGFTVGLSEKAFSLDEVVISVNRFAEKKTDIPQQVTVLSEKEIAFVNQPTSAGMLEQTGQVLVQRSQQAGGSPIMRGFEANKVLLVMDGVRLNNAIYRGGHLQNVITIDNANLNRTEIIFGPSSVVYGSDALGGVVHFYTKNPVLADSSGKTKINAQAFMRYATANNEKTGHAQVSAGWQKFGWFTSFTASDFGDLRAGKKRTDHYENWGQRHVYADRINNRDTMLVNPDPEIQKRSGYRQYDVLQKFLYQPNQKVSHKLNLQYSTASDAPRYDRLTEITSSGKPKFGEWYYGPQKRLLSAYSFEHKSNSRLYDQLNLIAAYQFIEESRHDRRFGKNDLNSRIEQLDVYSLNADLEKKLDRHELRFGTEGTFNNVHSRAHVTNIATGAKAPLSTRYPNGSTFRTLAGYFTHTWELSQKLTVTDGIRYSHTLLKAAFQSDFFPLPVKEVSQPAGALSGNAGLVFRPGHQWQISLLGSTGFRAPNIDDLAKVFESTAGQVIVPNPNLNPEYTYNLEAGITKEIAGKIKVQGIAWHTWYDDVITTQRATFNGSDSILYDGQMSRVLMMVNADRARLMGVSGSLWAEINPFLSVSSHLNYTYGRIQTDSVPYPLDHIPPLFGRTSVYLNAGGIKAEVFALYNGWKRLKDYNLVGEDNFNYATKAGTPAWYTLNIRLAYQVNPSFQVQGALENILDQHYRVFASGISAPGRNLVLTLRGSF